MESFRRREADALADAAVTATLSQPTMEKERWVSLIGRTMDMLGRRQAAGNCYDKLIDLYPNYTSYQLLGDYQAAGLSFDEAANCYEDAWDLDRTRRSRWKR